MAFYFHGRFFGLFLQQSVIIHTMHLDFCIFNISFSSISVDLNSRRVFYDYIARKIDRL